MPANSVSVRAKFKVTNISDNGDGMKSVSLAPVYSGSPENEKFFKYTPSGAISIGTVNAEAAESFEVGKEFYVDFTLAEAAPVVESPVVESQQTSSEVEGAMAASLEQIPGDLQASTQTETTAE